MYTKMKIWIESLKQLKSISSFALNANIRVLQKQKNIMELKILYTNLKNSSDDFFFPAFKHARGLQEE